MTKVGLGRCNINAQLSKKTASHFCLNCSVAQLCLPMGLNHTDSDKLNNVVKRRRTVKRGEYLFRRGDKFQNFYAISKGSFKNCTLTEDGREQIHGFYLSGELIGFDAVDTGYYICSAQALENSTVCEIPFEKLLFVASEVAGLQRQIINLMSQRLKNDASIPSNGDANERLAAFLLNITARLNRREPTLRDYYLPMSRQEIGNFLGFAVETVSRLFTQFQNDRILTVNGKRIWIEDYRQLQIKACYCPINRS